MNSCDQSVKGAADTGPPEPSQPPLRRILRFTRGQWDDIDSPILGAGDFDDDMRRAGYAALHRHGEEHSRLFVELYQHHHDDSHIVIANTCDRYYVVLVPDVASLFQLLALWLPVIEASHRLEEAEERRGERERRRRAERDEFVRIGPRGRKAVSR